jgi:hypothetical protein
MKKVLVFSFEDPQPPTITTAMVYASLGMQVKLVTLYCSPRTIEILASNGIITVCVLTKPPHECYSLLVRKYFAGLRKYVGYKPRVEFAWRPFRNATWRLLEDELPKTDMFWVASAWSACFLGGRLLKQSYVMHILELYEAETVMLKKFAMHAKCVVESDMSRAAIHRIWLGLKNTPVVIPNKPFYHPRKRCLPVDDANMKAVIQNCGGKKIIIYQGVIDMDRPLECFARAMHSLRDSVVWIIMGRYTSYLESLRKSCPGLIYVAYASPPDHLNVTSHASIGVIQYRSDRLNNVFCAPNKIWEYSGFGIPTLVPDVPSMRHFYDRFNAGEFCNFDNEDDIVYKVKKILATALEYEGGSNKLFESVDLVALYQMVSKNI